MVKTTAMAHDSDNFDDNEDGNSNDNDNGDDDSIW